MKVKAIKGVKDILPQDTAKWQWVENQARTVFSRFGYKEIRPPIFESTELFARGIGDTTDIVEKEMYTFTDKGGESLTLRPEGTASVVRSYVEHKMHYPPSVVKLYYLGPMFRYERPQAGRFRQFYQLGVEAMGSDNPAVDAEVMTMLIELLKKLGLNNLSLQINSLGCPECRSTYRDILKNAIRERLDKLCENCNQRYERNPLRIFDCKVEQDVETARELPKTKDHLCGNCQTHFDNVQNYLKITGTPYDLNDSLVRGLDYYSRTTFEIASNDLGAQNALCGGGRYDSLVEEFDGPPTPCFGFAVGMERLISVIPFEEVDGLDVSPDVYIVTLGDLAREESFRVAHELRSAGFSVEREYESGSMKSQMRKANAKECRFSLILGENEINTGKYVLKNMKEGSQQEIPREDLVQEVQRLLIP